MMELAEALEFVIGFGAGWAASYLFKKCEAGIAWVERLDPDVKFAVVCAFTCVLAWAAWGLKQLAPGAEWPVGAWGWLNTLFTVGFTAISGSQVAYAHNTLRSRRG